VTRRGIERLRRAARWPRGRSDGRALVLVYHRVAEPPSDPWHLAVTPRNFAEHLEVLREHARPIRLEQLSQALLERDLPDRSVVVTFDDGYADNLYNAKPLLERYGIPATVFLITGYIGHEREFWWDELERLLLQPGTLPERLSLIVGGATYRWELDEAAHYSEEDSQRHRRWRAGKEAPTLRHHLYRSLRELLKPLTEGERQRVVQELRGWAGAEEAVRPSNRPLSLEEVVALAQGDLIEVGAHTVTHPALRKLPAAAQRDEILGSKTRLKEILDRPVASFSYPYGGRPDYTAESVSIVREAGFSCACSNFVGVVKRSTDAFQLPRVRGLDLNGERFAKRLSRWLAE
jgi:peptidoglycan/xylan/chitin deacetylase (PgdA/CDA1 family)